MATRNSIARQLSRRFSPMARFRLARGLKQTDVAIRGGLHESTVSKIEIGARLPNEEQLRGCAKGLRTTLARARQLVKASRCWAYLGSSRKWVRP